MEDHTLGKEVITWLIDEPDERLPKFPARAGLNLVRATMMALGARSVPMPGNLGRSKGLPE